MIDLHTHSTASDGSEGPARVVELAAEVGCTAVALTDHDGFGGLPEAQRAAERLGVELVPGCEVSCDGPGGSVHLLTYFVAGGAFDDELGAIRTDRERRNAELVARLCALGMPVDAEELAAEAGEGLIGRPHVAAVLVRHGHATSVTDAFDRILGEGRAAYVPRAKLEPGRMIELARSVGGVAVLAHPLTTGLDPSALERYVASLADLGLGGIECLYGRYDAQTRDRLQVLARRRGIAPTGGSDFHGSYKPDLRVGVGKGDLRVPDELLDELKARQPA